MLMLFVTKPTEHLRARNVCNEDCRLVDANVKNAILILREPKAEHTLVELNLNNVWQQKDLLKNVSLQHK